MRGRKRQGSSPASSSRSNAKRESQESGTGARVPFIHLGSVLTAAQVDAYAHPVIPGPRQGPDKVFEMPTNAKFVKQVRKPRKTGQVQLQLTLTKRYGGNAAGWAYLKPPGKQAIIAGRYALGKPADGEAVEFVFDVSDECRTSAGFDEGGIYLLGLEPTDTGAYFALTGAKLTGRTRVLAEWSGEVESRRTFRPPCWRRCRRAHVPNQAKGPARSCCRCPPRSAGAVSHSHAVRRGGNDASARGQSDRVRWRRR